MKKTLDPTTIVNELRGQSAFFPARLSEEPAKQSVQPLHDQVTKELQTPPAKEEDTVIPRHHDTKQP